MWKRVQGMLLGLLLVGAIAWGRLWWQDHLLLQQVADVIAAAQASARQQQTAMMPSPSPAAPAPSGATP